MTNTFEHFWKIKGSDDVGAVGPMTSVSVKASEIEAVEALVFDVDLKFIQDGFADKLSEYLCEVIPELELRQTSPEGNLHAVLPFDKGVPVKTAQRLYDLLKPVLLTDPQSNWMAKARVAGCNKQKEGQEAYKVELKRRGSKVDAGELLARLTTVHDNTLAIDRLHFETLVKTFGKIDGRDYPCDPGAKGVCPLHGTGSNPEQCSFEANRARCCCFGDCNEGGKPGGHLIDSRAMCIARVIKEEHAEAFGLLDQPLARVMMSTDRPHDQVLREIARNLVESNKVFRQGDVVVRDHEQRLYPVDKGIAMSSLVGQHMEVVRVTSGRLDHVSISRDDGENLLHGPAYRELLPEIKLQTSVPVLGDDLLPSQPGYNAASQVFYTGKEVKPAKNTEHLDRLLNAIYFERDVDRTNFLGLVLTTLMGRRFMGERPMGVLRGNQPGIGKTTAAKIIGVLASDEGHIQSVSFCRNDEEFEKQLATNVQRGNVVVIDNVKPGNRSVVSSACLERTISDRRYNFRKLGSNQSISGDNCLLFLLTCNGGQLSPDLSSRSIPIRMNYHGDPHAMRDADVGDLVNYARQHRQALLAELWGLIQVWLHRGAEEIPVACRFKQWAAMVNGILVANGINGFLSTLQSDRDESDEAKANLAELARLRPDEWLKPTGWAATAVGADLLTTELAGKTTHSQATTLGILLKNAVGCSVSVIDPDADTETLYVLESKKDRKGAEYAFVPRDEPAGRHEREESAEPRGDAEPSSGGSPKGSAGKNNCLEDRNNTVPNLPNLKQPPPYIDTPLPHTPYRGRRSGVEGQQVRQPHRDDARPERGRMIQDCIEHLTHLETQNDD